MWDLTILVGTLEFYLPPKCYIYSDLSGLKNNRLQSGVFYISYSPATEWHFKITLKEGHVTYRLIDIEDKNENCNDNLEFKYKYDDFYGCLHFIVNQTNISITTLTNVLQDIDIDESELEYDDESEYDDEESENE